MSDGGASPGGTSGDVGHCPPPYTPPERSGGLELRSPLDCWACAVLVSAHNVLVAAFNLLLLAAIVTSILLPAAIMVAFGLACHSQILDLPAGRCKEALGDGGSAALVAVGSVLAAPLAVLALAAYCRLARHLQLSLCFVPYSKAVYRNLPASRYRGAGVCCLQPGETAGKVWV